MSGFQQKDNTGALFKNEEKQDPNHADYQGTITVAGQEYWINAWVNTAKSSGKKFFGLTVKEKQARKPKRQEPAPQQGKLDDFDDDIPF